MQNMRNKSESQEHPNSRQANQQFPFSFSKLVRVPSLGYCSDTLQPERLRCGWSKSVKQSSWKCPNGSGHWRLQILAGNCLELNIHISGGSFLLEKAAMSMLQHPEMQTLSFAWGVTKMDSLKRLNDVGFFSQKAQKLNVVQCSFQGFFCLPLPQ